MSIDPFIAYEGHSTVYTVDQPNNQNHSTVLDILRTQPSEISSELQNFQRYPYSVFSCLGYSEGPDAKNYVMAQDIVG